MTRRRAAAIGIALIMSSGAYSSANAIPITAALFTGFSGGAGPTSGMGLLDTYLNQVFPDSDFTSQVFRRTEVEQARQFLESSANQNFVIIGHSFGGEAARSLAEGFGSRTVDMLIQIDSVNCQPSSPTCFEADGFGFFDILEADVKDEFTSVLPANVKQGFNFFQTTPSPGLLAPQGDRIVIDSTNVNVEDYFIDTDIDHTSIDGYVPLHGLITELMRDQFADSGFYGFSSNAIDEPDVLANAAVAFDSGIYVVPNSAQFIGNISPGSASFFEDLNLGTAGNESFDLGSGILLTSGNGTPPLSNTQQALSATASGQGDSRLDTITAGSGQQTTDSSSLAFQFHAKPDINAIEVSFVFGTEEFPDQGVIDIAGIFVDGINRAAFADGHPLSFVVGAPSAANFLDNNQNHTGGVSPLEIEYDGISRRLTLRAPLDTSLDLHSIEIIISDTADRIFDSGIFVSDIRGLSVVGPGGTGFSPADPLLPVAGDDPSNGFDFQITIGDTGFGVDPTQPIFIDPPFAIGYVYESFGPNFASVLLPSDIGDGNYTLSVFDGFIFSIIADIVGGTSFSFLDLYPLGIDAFIVGGIEMTAGLDPNDPTAFVTGVTFVSGGSFGVNMKAITSAAVPEPPTLLLLISALVLLSMIRYTMDSWRVHTRASAQKTFNEIPAPHTRSYNSHNRTSTYSGIRFFLGPAR